MAVRVQRVGLGNADDSSFEDVTGGAEHVVLVLYLREEGPGFVDIRSQEKLCVGGCRYKTLLPIEVESSLSLSAFKQQGSKVVEDGRRA